MEVYLIRHGATKGNTERRFVGSTDEPLTKESESALKDSRPFYPEADTVFVSPLKRCKETSFLLYPGQKQQIVQDFREIDFGDFEYGNAEELDWDPRYHDWIESGGTLAFPGGESREVFTERCCEAFKSVCTDLKESSRAAFVVHGGTIMAILSRYAEPQRDFYEWQVKNAEGFACEAVFEPCFHLKVLRSLPETPALTGIEDYSVRKEQKQMNFGYTTGTCAAAAAQAAAFMLLTGRVRYRADILTPKGIRLHLPIESQEITETSASCSVRKYAGDDPDVTDGVCICARAEYADSGDLPRVGIEGGRGVGRVTRPGLEQPVGEAAINRVPREMITREVLSVFDDCEFNGKMKITISVPEGEKIAERTFNPNLGIEGGISILGTSGIVEPMSETALVESIRTEIRQKIACGAEYLLITPGNYGMEYLRRETDESQSKSGQESFIRALRAENAVKCSNYVGETLDAAVEYGAKGVLFVAHIGKFIKVSGGIMNTHSAQADCRSELFAAQAMRSGAPSGVVNRLLASNTSEEAVGILKDAGCLDTTMREVTGRIRKQLQKHCNGAIETEAILYSNRYGYLGETEGAGKIAERMVLQDGDN